MAQLAKAAGDAVAGLSRLLVLYERGQELARVPIDGQAAMVTRTGRPDSWSITDQFGHPLLVGRIGDGVPDIGQVMVGSLLLIETFDVMPQRMN